MLKRVLKPVFFCIFMLALVVEINAQNKKGGKIFVETISFGSCNKHDLPQPLWNSIIADDPDIWIWLGDIIYGDTHEMALLNEKYSQQKDLIDYRRLRLNTSVIGIWDDHDYGINDGGKYYGKKKESQQILLDFLDEPKDSPRRKQEGAYASYTYGIGENSIKVILLDTRYHRDTLFRESGKYLPNLNGTILGEEQWNWLERELKNSTARINIIASGIQIIPTEHPFEKWANFPNERERLLDLIANSKVKNPILLSGDRHIAEISQLKDKRFPLGIVEITSSGMTHTWSSYREEYNPYRIGNLIASLHYGTLKLDWENEWMTFYIKGEQGQIYLEQRIPIR
ncbi:alkaline phosphatase D family protein [Cecembia calidifontis]|jgi:alkaline phosphatase D|uniref:Alkaline phosphatase D n=1 Tax=Cecembia calidifontis TaxID=1187080 RepID=A0A4Q7PE90_9BACT|nr:alkaline phosphatase D family protein [Cecembia calidifontis]RZS97960.1 alkaline phosphatase D [Cecembia calidifontis]